MDNNSDISNEDKAFLKSIEIEEKVGEINENTAALKELAEVGITHWFEARQLAANTEKEEMELENKIHARNIKFATIALVGFIAIVITALFLGMTNTADTIIDSLFKFLAGAGVVGYFARNSRKEK